LVFVRDAIVAHAAANDITASHQTRFGTRYEIDGPLLTPDGRAAILKVNEREWAGIKAGWRSSNRHPALGYLLEHDVSENRYPVFGIMLRAGPPIHAEE
jgi:hypothetical protein